MTTALAPARPLPLRLLVAILIAPIRFYRRFVSPLLPPACRYEPSCSVYAMQAIQIHGPFRGLGLAIYRISRCQPFGGCGHDPVPPLKPSHARGAT